MSGSGGTGRAAVLTEAQKQLVNALADRVKPLAQWMHGIYPAADYAELESTCQWGLILAAQRHEESLGPFERYAVTTMRLEMKNVVRKMLGLRLRESARATDFEDQSDEDHATGNALAAALMRSDGDDSSDVRRNLRLRAAHGALQIMRLGGEDEHHRRRQWAMGYRVLDELAERSMRQRNS